MRYLHIYLAALGTLSPTHAISHGAAQLRDLLAYPKYDVQFLNDLPLSHSDAEQAKTMGVETEDEWFDIKLQTRDRRRLGDGNDTPLAERLRLIPMSFAPPGTHLSADYLCLMPSANSTDSQIVRTDLDEHIELDPVQSWAALSHLEGKCLYSKQGWFTYSYCHNSEIRQFRAARHHHPHPPSGHEPEEDAKYDAYTLGQAHQQAATRRSKSGNKPPAKNKANAPGSPPSKLDTAPGTVSVGESASSRYLVQRWSDGTTCDKTNRPREIEVQVHCSMTTTDVIYLVKEMAICQYVMIIHSPHLCSLPGFRAPHADVEPAGIRCRQVVSDEDFEKWSSEDQGDDKNPAEGREAQLRLPWQAAKPTTGHEEKHQSWDKQTDEEPINGQNDDLEAYMVDDLQQYLIEALGQQTELDAGKEEEFLVVALEEDEDGTVHLQTETVDGKKLKLDGDDKEQLWKAVKEFLESKAASKADRVDADEDDNDKNRVKDEL